MGRVRLETRRLRQLDEVVADQPPAGMRCSDESEERTRKRLLSMAAGIAAVPPTEVRSESIQLKSRKRAAATAIVDHDPLMAGHEETADDDVTICSWTGFGWTWR